MHEVHGSAHRVVWLIHGAALIEHMGAQLHLHVCKRQANSWMLDSKLVCCTRQAEAL
jgi:hypothetical protein